MHAFGSTSGTGWDVCKILFGSNLSAQVCKPNGVSHASLLTCHGTIACGAIQLCACWMYVSFACKDKESFAAQVHLLSCCCDLASSVRCLTLWSHMYNSYKHNDHIIVDGMGFVSHSPCILFHEDILQGFLIAVICLDWHMHVVMSRFFMSLMLILALPASTFPTAWGL